ncbi:MAG: NAD-dependent epimerase [Hyphomicrobiales bacterium]|nr:MAG: NAD-dependent epimerase [Hyphomicrobiales bacterium]
MKIVITGGYGFLGQLLAKKLLEIGKLVDRNGDLKTIDDIILIDQIEPKNPIKDVRSIFGDISEPIFFNQAITDDVDGVFHLAAIVSSAAEADFDLGMKVNLDATRILLERCRKLPNKAKIVFSSSVAVFGNAPLIVEDDTPALPLSSYGMQKILGEYLISEYTRKNYIDGRCVRLPTIAIRPGKPNKAASSFVSSIIREPLSGENAICPVDRSQSLWIQSPSVIIENLIHAYNLNQQEWGTESRVVNLPGLTITVAEMIASLKTHGGNTSLIIDKPDETISRLVKSWPGAMNTKRARKMGFKNNDNFDSMIEEFIDQQIS